MGRTCGSLRSAPVQHVIRALYRELRAFLHARARSPAARLCSRYRSIAMPRAASVAPLIALGERRVRVDRREQRLAR